jgi:hypothetical protein
MPAPYADHLQSSNDFMNCFTDGVFSGRVGHNKPEQAIFELAAQALWRGHAARPAVHGRPPAQHRTQRTRWGGRRCSSPTRRRRGPCCMSGHWSAELR